MPTITANIKTKRGNKVDIPTLETGEQGFCNDTRELFIGHSTGNKRISFPAYILSNFCVGDDLADNQSAFESLLNIISTDKATIVIDEGTYICSDNLTIPSNVCLYFHGGILKGTGSKTLTINGRVKTFDSQMFSGWGTYAGTPKCDYVSYENFGAALDGSDDLTAIRNTHNFANLNNITVKQNAGIIYFTDYVYVKSNVDLTGATFLLNEGNKNKNLYNILPNTSFASAIGITQAELVKNTFMIASFSGYPNSLIKIVSDELKGYRGGDLAKPYYKTDLFTHTRDGILASGLSIEDFTSGTLTITQRPIDVSKLTFIGCDIDYQITDVEKTSRIIYNKRDNVIIKDFNIPIADEDSVKGNTAYKGALFESYDCYNVTYLNIFGSNIVGDVIVTYQESGYVIANENVNRINIDNCDIVSTGWGCMSSIRAKNINVRDSKLTRIDCHWGLYDMMVDNCELINFGLSVGEGKGKVTIKDSTIIYTNYKTYPGIIALRGDLGELFSGIITVKDIRVINKTSGNFELFRLQLPDEDTNAATVNMPDIVVNNVQVESDYEMFILNFTASTVPATVKEFYLPKNINIRNVYNINEDDSKYINAIYMNNVNGKIKSNGCDILIDSVNRLDYSKMASGYTTAELENYAYETGVTQKKMLFRTSNNSEVGKSFSVSAKIKNSYGCVFSNNTLADIDIRNSRIHMLLNGKDANTFAKSITIIDSVTTGYPNSTATYSIYQVKNMTMIDSIIQHLIIDSAETYAAVSGDTPNILKNNFFTGIAQQASTLKKFLHTYDTSKYSFGENEFSATYNPISLADGEGVTTTISASGASLGDYVLPSFSLDLTGVIVTAWVSSSNVISIRFQNETGGVVDLASGTLKVKLIKA
jgi:hypothetical protein